MLAPASFWPCKCGEHCALALSGFTLFFTLLKRNLSLGDIESELVL